VKYVLTILAACGVLAGACDRGGPPDVRTQAVSGVVADARTIS
jgi:hypothetical protein